jgi:hypothetical protein
MPSTKLVIGGAAAGAAIGVRVARSLYGRWRVLPAADRERIAGFAEDAKEKALSVRGANDPTLARQTCGRPARPWPLPSWRPPSPIPRSRRTR